MYKTRLLDPTFKLTWSLSCEICNSIWISFFLKSFMFIPYWNLFWVPVVFNICEINAILTSIMSYKSMPSYYGKLNKMYFNSTLPLQFMPRLLPINWLQYFLSHVSRVLVCFSPIKRGPQVTCGIKPGYLARVSQHQLNSSCKVFRHLICMIRNIYY